MSTVIVIKGNKGVSYIPRAVAIRNARAEARKAYKLARSEHAVVGDWRNNTARQASFEEAVKAQQAEQREE